MTKKEYKKPLFNIVHIDLSSLLAGSGTTGATGEDIPWAAKEACKFDEISLDDEE